jgi:hypothetical protein
MQNMKERSMYKADSKKALSVLSEELAKEYPNQILLFRGQNNLFPSVRSGRARYEGQFNHNVDHCWSVVAGYIIGSSDQEDTRHLRKAVLQHYGFVTEYVDLTSDIHIAAWFALNEYQFKDIVWAGGPPRRFKQVRYTPRKQGKGYVIVMAVPHDHLSAEPRNLFDVSNILNLIRPARQQAWLMLDRAPSHDPNAFWAATIEIDCEDVRIPMTTSELFPSTEDDPGYRALLSFPFVQAQSSLLESEGSDSATEIHRVLLKNSIPYFATRSIDAPEYVNEFGHGYYDHKWQDSTLFEPPSMQNWFRWSFRLQNRYVGLNGDIGNAKKISVAPNAHEILASKDFQATLGWPDIGAEDLLFTYSQHAYDKVDDMTWPFRGVWLHRDQELILEHPVTADVDKLNVHAGHAYILREGELVRRSFEGACQCDAPATHDTRVRSMLSLNSHLDRERIILLPHPMNLKNCYIAL